MAFIVCSSDSDDLVAVCDRVLVLHDGRISAELTGHDIEETTLLMMMVRPVETTDVERERGSA